MNEDDYEGGITELTVESICLAAEDTPLVRIVLGNRCTEITPEMARMLATSLFQASFAAEQASKIAQAVNDLIPDDLPEDERRHMISAVLDGFHGLTGGGIEE